MSSQSIKPLPSIIHIHSDSKFLFTTSYFSNDFFQNKVFLLDSNKNALEENNEIFFVDSTKKLVEITSACNGADLVVLYCLDAIKAKIATLIDKNVKIAWFFFGFELYRKDLNSYLSVTTKNVIYGNAKGRLINYVKTVTKQFLLKNVYQHFQFKKLLKRVDYFIGLSTYEYNYLTGRWPYLPPYLQMPIVFKDEKPIEDTNKKNNSIIVGNNRNIWNNHFDILKTIDKTQDSEKYNFILPLSYGSKDIYFYNVLEKIKHKSNIVALTNFMPLAQYEELFIKASAFVLNSYRPMAMGNIFIAIVKGLKLYLNPKNTTYQWLLDFGFFVFNIEDFIADLAADNINLKNHESQRNFLLFEELANDCSIINFKDKINEKLTCL